MPEKINDLRGSYCRCVRGLPARAKGTGLEHIGSANLCPGREFRFRLGYVSLSSASGTARRHRTLSLVDPRASLDRSEHQWPGSANSSRSLEPPAMAACGSESGRWANTHRISASEPNAEIGGGSTRGFRLISVIPLAERPMPLEVFPLPFAGSVLDKSIGPELVPKMLEIATEPLRGYPVLRERRSLRNVDPELRGESQS